MKPGATDRVWVGVDRAIGPDMTVVSLYEFDEKSATGLALQDEMTLEEFRDRYPDALEP